jgi:transglutaminase-like putative cysteine protease
VRSPVLHAALALALAGAACRGEAAPAAPASAPGKPPPAAAAPAAAGSPPPAAPRRPPDVVTLARPGGREWFGLYLVGRKAGYTWMEVGLERRGGQSVLVARAETSLTATLGGRTVTRLQRDEKVYQARPRGRLLAFSTRRAGDGGDRSFTGTCGERTCEVVVASAGSRETRSIPHPGETAEQADGARLAAALRGPVRGAQLQADQLRVRQVEDVWVGRRRLGGAGVEVEVSVVTEREQGDRAAIEVLVADDGRVAEMRLGGSVVARAEPEEVARRLDRVDLFNLTRVPLPGPLPRTVPGAVTYRLRGLPEGFRKGDERQRFGPAAGGDAVLTVSARLPAAADPARDAPRAAGAAPGDEHLAPTPEVDSDAPAIRALAAEVAGDARGAWAAARRLNQHVHRRLEKTFGQSRDRASEVLAGGKGDCTEHALLLVALARAAGVPARLVHGLVYARYGDGADALYWHAWAEVRSGGEWIAMDPTLGQDVADATHLALGRGTQVDTVGLLGELRVLAADPAPAAP